METADALNLALISLLSFVSRAAAAALTTEFWLGDRGARRTGPSGGQAGEVPAAKGNAASRATTAERRADHMTNERRRIRERPQNR